MHRLAVFITAVGVFAASACGGTSESTSEPQQPLPTIGIGSDVDAGGGAAAVGEVTVGADVRVVGSTEVDTVVMVGDSITVASEVALEEIFRRLGFRHVLIESQESKRIAVGRDSNPSGVAVVEELVDQIESDDTDLAGGDPSDHSNELWVIALGTNDVDQYSDSAERAAAVNELLSAVPAESPLIWIDTFFRDREDGTDEINEVIRSRVLQRGNSAIARWSIVADGDGNLRTDGVHPRDQGTIVFANILGAAIVDFFDLA